MREFEDRLTREIGLDPKSLGAEAVWTAVKKRMEDCDTGDPADYLKLISSSREELQALIEAVVVGETWFFRDREPFVLLTSFVSGEWLQAHRARPLRILSVPCSSGEEPYSAAITLLEMGFGPRQYEIDAVDISLFSLAKAERAVYGNTSFRGVDPMTRQRYFTPDGNGFRLCPEAREGVRFRAGNIIDPSFMADARPYDVVFCRNLLIYQKEEARLFVIKTLDRLLIEEGLLFVGHAEVLPPLLERFSHVRHQGAFAFRKGPKNGDGSLSAKNPSQTTVAAAQTTNRPWPAPSQTRFAPGPIVRPPVRAVQKEEPSLDRARDLADHGLILEAGQLCEEILKKERKNKWAYFLLGLVREAEGRVREAEECLNKAIYLDAGYVEALQHLSLLMERRGDAAAAERVRRRAAEAAEREKGPSK